MAGQQGPPRGAARLIALVRPWFKRAGRTKAFTWIASNAFAPLDRRLYRWTKGRFALAQFAAPTLFLTTIGRKTGEPRTTPVLYLRDGGNLIVVEANWGQQRRPAWSINLLANPHAAIQIAGRKQEVQARLATQDEKTRLWPELLTVWPAWQAYEDQRGRDTRVYVLTPTDSSMG